MTCILWTGAVTSSGYGCRRFRGRCESAHVVAYIEAKGEIPAGREIDHTCRTQLCINPDHLEAVTHLENVRRSRASKLSMEQARAIRAAEGTIIAIGERFGVHNSTVSRIRSGQIWREAA